MAVSSIVRNLRDGELILRDGSDPAQTLTIVLDEGDLSWTARQSTIEVKDRGSITAGHTRPGEDESVSLSFSAKWTQLLGKAAAGADPLQLYEMLMFEPDANLVSTSEPGEQNTLALDFRVVDPTGTASESILFAKVYRQSLTMSEGDEFNLISFTGRDFEVAPTVSRV